MRKDVRFKEKRISLQIKTAQQCGQVVPMDFTGVGGGRPLNLANLHNNVFAVTNDDDDDDDRVSRSKGWANWTKLTPINTFRDTS